MKNILTCLSISALVLMGCGSSRSTTNDRKDVAEIQPVGEPIPPGHCRIVGTILKIDQELKSSDPKDPCSKVPCSSLVRVDSVLGYGSAFGNPLSPGGKISINFGFTLSPTTKELFPTLSDSYPGLKEGSTFEANVRESQTMGSAGISYFVYQYHVR